MLNAIQISTTDRQTHIKMDITDRQHIGFILINTKYCKNLFINLLDFQMWNALQEDKEKLSQEIGLSSPQKFPPLNYD